MSEDTRKPSSSDKQPAQSSGVSDRTSLERLLAEAVSERDTFKHVIDAQLDTFFLFEPNTGRAVRWNRAFRDISGYTDEEIARMPAPASYYGPEDLERAKTCIQRVLKEGGCTVELELRCRDGRRVPTEYRVSPITDGSGQGNCLIAIGRDITERKRVESALRERVKELDCLYRVATLVEQKDQTIETTMQEAVNLIPASWQYPEVTCARVDMGSTSFTTEKCDRAAPVSEQSSDIVIDGEVAGRLTVHYLEERPPADEGPFLKEERKLLDAIAQHLSVMEGRRRAATAVRASETRLRSFMESATEGVVIYDSGLNLTDINETALAIFPPETGIEQLRGKNILEIVPGLKQTGRYDAYLRVIETGVPLCFDDLVPHSIFGDRRLTIRAFRVADGLGVMFTDITERKKSERALRESEENLREAQRVARAGSWDWNIASGELSWSDEAYRIYGLKPQQLAPTYELFSSVLHPGDRDLVQRSVEAALSGTAAYDIDFRFVRPNGEIGWVHCEGEVTRDKEGNPVRFFGVQIDITERIQAEKREKELREKLARAERMESVGVLAGGIAHDLNNLLCPNVMLPSLILDDLEDVTREQCENIEYVRENLAAIEQSSSRAAETVKDIAVLSKSQVRPQTPLDINAAVTQYLKSHEFKTLRESARTVSFKADLDKDNPWIPGTRSHVDRLLSNLVRNAVLAVDGGGAVTIRTSSVCVANPIVGYELIERGDYVLLEVSDTGVGIDPEVLERVFEPFFTTRKQANRAGSGLGLSVVHGIVKNHGGAIDMKTAVGQGTTFALYLPALKALPNQAGAVEDAPPKGTERILVVDDEPTQILTARRALERLGYSTEGAANGHEAVALFEQAKTKGEDAPFDLVVLDMLMEPGFDGITTLNEVLKLYPEQKAMIASGHAGDEQAEEEARKLGASWLAKPYRREDIARAVRKRLDRST
jgi:PAS domain S-box-containing protein